MDIIRPYDIEAEFTRIQLNKVDTSANDHVYKSSQDSNFTKKSNNTIDMKEYNPYENRMILRPTTYLNTLAHLLKANLGIGILAMPLAFKNAGYVVGIFGTILVGLLCIVTMHLLTNACYELCSRKRIPCLTYAATTKEAFLNGPESLKPFAVAAEFITNIFLVFYQVGSSCSYLIFMAENIKAVVDLSFGNDIPIQWYKVGMLTILIPIALVRDLKLLSPFSTTATGMTIASFGIICWYILKEPLTLIDRKQYGELKDIPLFFCTVLFAMEAIGVILPLEQEMKKPKQFSSRFGVLNVALLPVTFFYAFIGAIGYLKYGSNIKDTVNLNLPHNEVLSIVVKFLLSSSIYICYALSNYVALDILWKSVESYKEGISDKMFWESMLRISIVFTTFFFAMVIPKLNLIINLIGALCLSSMGIALPAIIYHMTFYNQRRMQGKRAYFMFCVQNFIIVLIGLLAMFFGTVISVKDIINNMFS